MFKAFIKRFLLIIIGIFLSLIVLECGLRITGWTISSYQQYKNNKVLRNKSQYKIMCLGESTTDEQYPIQLQKILDKKYPNKFSVIDCGIAGTRLETILDSLNNNINKYHPDITVCMMGINNGFTDIDNIQYKNMNLKIFKLFILIKKHLTSLLKENIVFAEQVLSKNDQLYEHAVFLVKSKKYKEAEQILKKILESDTNNEKCFLALSELYNDHFNQEIGYNMAIEAIKKKFNFGKERYYKIIFEYCYRKNDIDELKFYINKAINEDIYIFLTDESNILYGYISKYITISQRYKLFDIMFNNSYCIDIFKLLFVDAIENKDYRKAKEYFNKAEEIRVNFPNIETYNLYKLIIKKLVDNDIKVICMQYPVRSILSLKKQLQNEPYYDKIIFISNEKLFKNILMKKDYGDLFADQFAGDFGHCTDLGNTLIAENVVHTLETILNLKRKSIIKKI